MCDCKEENLYLVVGCDANSQNMVWDSTNCNDRGVALLEFLNFMNLEILNQGNDSTFCSARRLEVMIPWGPLDSWKNFKTWEVSSEPSLSFHRHTLYSVHFGGLHTSTPDQESWGYQLGLLMGGTEGQVGMGPGNEHGR